MHEDDGRLNENDLHRLIFFNIWSLAGELFGKD